MLFNISASIFAECTPWLTFMQLEHNRPPLNNNFKENVSKKDQLETEFFYVVRLPALDLFARLLNSIVCCHSTIGTHYKSISSYLYVHTQTHMSVCESVCMCNSNIRLFLYT